MANNYGELSINRNVYIVNDSGMIFQQLNHLAR